MGRDLGQEWRSDPRYARIRDGVGEGLLAHIFDPKNAVREKVQPQKRKVRGEKSKSSPPGRWEGERHVGLGDRQGSEKEEDRGRGRGLRRPP